MSRRVAVIGAGIGGLAAAIRLASAGCRVEVFEALAAAGGKAGTASSDGVTFDTGPSLLTMPEVFDDLFRCAGTSLAAEVALVDPSPAFRYLWPDGATVDLYRRPEETLCSVERALGAAAARELERYLGYAREIWEASDEAFVSGAAPTLGGLLRMGPATLAKFRKIDPMRSMERAIRSYISEPHLRDICLRYATYNGSDPRVAPATLNCIGWVELGLGGYGVQGGLYALVEALVRIAERQGVVFHFGARVEEVVRSGRQVRGLRLAGGATVEADAVVANADASHLHARLLGEHAAEAPLAPSTSGMTLVLRAARSDARVAHTVLFPSDYGAEFADMFDSNRPPEEPTVYLCAQSRSHLRAGWADAEPLFAMANAPAEPASGSSPAETWDALESRMLARARGAGLVHATDEVVWRRSPTDLAALFPDTRGALYGAASNDRFAAFRRPANRSSLVDGLFLASGSAHPGGGLPLCALSGRRAALEAGRFLGLP